MRTTMNAQTGTSKTIKLYRTPEHQCSYRENQLARTVFIEPNTHITPKINSELSEVGFRRSGSHIYRPDCKTCKACVPCRIDVKNFQWSSRFKRVWRKNQDLKIAEVGTLDDQESIQLYQNYIASKHRDGDMYPATPEQFQDFIAIRTPSTKFIKIRYHDTLCAVSIVDYLENGLSAVYTYYDTSLASRSLGYLAILYQIKRAESLNLSYVFLGYWIKQCKKMSYKTDFRPIELLVSNRWLKAK